MMNYWNKTYEKPSHIRFIPHPFSTFKWFIHIAQLPKGLCWLLFRQSNWIINAHLIHKNILFSIVCLKYLTNELWSSCSWGSSSAPYKMNVRLKILRWARAHGHWAHLAVVQWLQDNSANNYIGGKFLNSLLNSFELPSFTSEIIISSKSEIHLIQKQTNKQTNK